VNQMGGQNHRTSLANPWLAIAFDQTSNASVAFAAEMNDIIHRAGLQ